MVAEEGMTLVCEGCQSAFRVPSGKIPPGKTVAVTCPKCRHRFSFTAPDGGRSKEAFPRSPASMEGGRENSPAASALTFAEEEGERALVCVEDPDLLDEIRHTLELMEYQVMCVGAPHEALKVLRMHTCHLVVVYEGFGEVSAERNSVLLYLERLPMMLRREMFVVMLSQRHSTLDSLVAFVRSVNLVVNVRHVPDLERLLKQGIADSRHFYEVFLEALKEEGRR